MTKRIRMASLIAMFGALMILPDLSAQNDVRVTVAGLKQDMALLSQEVRALRLEIEQMHRDNATLRTQVQAAQSNQTTQTQIANLSTAIDTLRREYRAADESNKKVIIAEVSRQIEALAHETQSALYSVAHATAAEPNISTPTHFADDYPKTGITYTVRSGDTLSKIARAHGSTIKHIQNANKIVNPARDLQVGQSIFIPIAQ